MLGAERYRQLSKMRVWWNLITESHPVTEAEPVKAALDHCAPGLSKAERLRRLAQHWTLRGTSTGSYSVGGSATFLGLDGSLLHCG